MQVDFDNIRRLGSRSFNNLVEKLNDYIEEDGNAVGYNYKWGDRLTVRDIKGDINGIRNCLAAMLSIDDKKHGIKSLDIELNEFAPEE